MSSKFETSKAAGAHKLLAHMEGNWEGIAKTWFEADILGDESPMQANMRLILDGRFLMIGYAGSMQGQPHEGLMLLGKQLSTDKFQTVWLDSFHTGTDMMFSESKRGADVLSVLGTYVYATPEKETIWGWRTKIDMLHENKIIITAFNVAPDGEETKATEVVYKRIKEEQQKS